MRHFDLDFGCWTQPHGKQFCEIEPVTMGLIAAGGLQAGGSILSGLFQSGAAEESAEAAKVIAQMQIQAAERAEGRAVQRLTPFIEPGKEAVGVFRDVFLGGEGAPTLTRFVEDSPLYNVLGDLGERDINRSLSARGLFGSGAGVEALSDFRRKLLVDVAGQFLRGTEFLTRLGQNSAALTADAALNTGRTTAASLADLGKSLTSSSAVHGQAFGNIAEGVAGAGSAVFGDLAGLEWLDRFRADLRRNNLPSLANMGTSSAVNTGQAGRLLSSTVQPFQTQSFRTF